MLLNFIVFSSEAAKIKLFVGRNCNLQWNDNRIFYFFPDPGPMCVLLATARHVFFSLEKSTLTFLDVMVHKMFCFLLMFRFSKLQLLDCKYQFSFCLCSCALCPEDDENRGLDP
jgi:hypothetical protein